MTGSLPLILILLYSVGAYAVIPTADDYIVQGMEEYGSRDETYAGYMPIDFEDNSEGSFFFWMAKERKKKDRVLIWLNGGPGCSSMLGMLSEHGPFNLKDGPNRTYALQYNPYSWNEEAHVIYVEQPIRTGFSQAASGARLIRSEQMVAEDFRGFLSSFLDVFPYLQGLPVYISGESYAGFYIPWIAHHILYAQENPPRPSVTRVFNHINLQGAAIGNGVTDDIIQTPSYAEYAYMHGLIPLKAKEYIDKQWMKCLERLQFSRKRLTRGSISDCGIMELVLKAAGGPNEYNTATFNSYDAVLKPGEVFDRFFNDPHIQTLLHARGGSKEHPLPGINFQPGSTGSFKGGEFQPTHWGVCNDDINEAMLADHPISAVPALKYVSQRIRLLLYNGEFDLNCNFLGVLHTLEANEWGGVPWKQATRSLWKYGGDVAGEHFNIDKLSFLIVRNSGHLLPMDQPAAALDMLRRFLDNESFADVHLPTEESYEHFYDDDDIAASLKASRPVLPTTQGSEIMLVFGAMCVVLPALLILRIARSTRKHRRNYIQSITMRKRI